MLCRSSQASSNWQAWPRAPHRNTMVCAWPETLWDKGPLLAERLAQRFDRQRPW